MESRTKSVSGPGRGDNKPIMASRETKQIPDGVGTETSDDDRASKRDAAHETVEKLSDDAFRDQLGEVIPHLRAFGRSLSGNRDTADDLVQETLLKAWAARARFHAGTSMRAWTFTILRNLFLSQMRRARFKGEWDDLTAERSLAAPASQDGSVNLSDLQRALMMLPQNQREALILVGAGGFAYEEAADICGVAVGTIKSRVARGRVALEEIMSGTELPRRSDAGVSGEAALSEILSDVDRLSRQA